MCYPWIIYTCKWIVAIGHDGREALSLGKPLMFDPLSSVNAASGIWGGVAQIFLKVGVLF